MVATPPAAAAPPTPGPVILVIQILPAADYATRSTSTLTPAISGIPAMFITVSVPLGTQPAAEGSCHFVWGLCHLVVGPERTLSSGSGLPSDRASSPSSTAPTAGSPFQAGGARAHARSWRRSLEPRPTPACRRRSAPTRSASAPWSARCARRDPLNGHRARGSADVARESRCCRSAHGQWPVSARVRRPAAGMTFAYQRAVRWLIPSLGLVLVAEGRPARAAEPSAPVSDVSVLSQSGAFLLRSKEGDIGGIGFTLSGLYRRGPIVAGASLMDMGLGLAVAYYGACGLLGASLRPSSSWRIDLLGAGGARAYWWAFGVLNDDPGTGAVLPYAGGRLQAMYLFGSQRNHFALGAMVAFDLDLTSVNRRYQYQSTSWFSGEPYTTTADHTVGGQRIWVGITLGWVRDLRP